MDKINLKFENLFAKLKSKKIVYVKKLINPTHDWNVFLSVTVVVLIFGFLTTLYLYEQIDSGLLFSKPNESVSEKLVRINQSSLDKNIEEIKNKKIQSENIGKNVPSDPSI